MSRSGSTHPASYTLRTTVSVAAARTTRSRHDEAVMSRDVPDDCRPDSTCDLAHKPNALLMRPTLHATNSGRIFTSRSKYHGRIGCRYHRNRNRCRTGQEHQGDDQHHPEGCDG